MKETARIVSAFGTPQIGGATPEEQAFLQRLVAVTPSPRQKAHETLEYYSFLHFGMNTMTNRLCGRSYALTGNAFRLDGYTFLGWSTDPYAYVPMYLNRARITNLTTQNGATVTLYAVWQANSLRSSQ